MLSTPLNVIAVGHDGSRRGQARTRRWSRHCHRPGRRYRSTPLAATRRWWSLRSNLGSPPRTRRFRMLLQLRGSRQATAPGCGCGGLGVASRLAARPRMVLTLAASRGDPRATRADRHWRHLMSVSRASRDRWWMRTVRGVELLLRDSGQRRNFPRGWE